MKTFKLFWILMVAVLFFASTSNAKVPIELGRVSWERDLSKATEKSEASGKPIFMLFQEVPGCATCSIYGREILSNPLMVEAIEDLFIPVLTYNNRSGADRDRLQEFKEPAWNFPVVRYLDAEGKDLLPRQDRIWKLGETASRMIKVLNKMENTVPVYLQLLADEHALQNFQQATFAMGCFWEGEARLGSLSGVVKSRAGWLSGSEVVEVFYNPEKIEYEELVQKAQQMQCASRVFAHSKNQMKTAKGHVGKQAEQTKKSARDAKSSDQKFALKRTPFRYLPLTAMQETKINSALRLGGEPEKWLSPRQQRLLLSVKKATKKNVKVLAELKTSGNSRDLVVYQQRLIDTLSRMGIYDL